MPRKKREQTTVKYYIPKGAKKRIDHIVDTSEFYKNKPIWKQKFYILCDYIADQNFKLELDVDKQYVNIHQETMAEVIGVNNRNMAVILKDAVSSELLKRDGLFQVALKRKGKSAGHIHKGKSYGYQFKEWNELEEIITTDHRRSYKKTIVAEVLNKKPLSKDLSQYSDVLNCIKIDETNIDEIISAVIFNKKEKRKQQQLYWSFIRKAEVAFNEQKTALSPKRRILNDCCVEMYYRESNKGISNSSKNNNNIHTHIPFDGTIVPVKVQVDEPYTYRGGDKLCEPSVFEIRYFKKKKGKVEEKEETTVARCKRALYYINYVPTLPKRIGDSGRVFTSIASLNREFRTSIRLDGKKIVGLDIANSQPLLASILIKRWWSKNNVEMPADVLQYQKDCEEGQFYNNFMKELNVPDDLRSQFKQDFFNKVFFSKVIEKNNMLKDVFIKKYPNCWEAICNIKGGLYDNEQYKVFATTLQELEAFIIFDTVNMALIERGIKAFNIFDSIYVTSKEDYEAAEQMTREAFREVGLNPTFKMEYKEHRS